MLIILVSILPGLFWLWYFNRYDHWEKEPLGLIFLCLLYGALAVLPALAWEAPFHQLTQEAASLPQKLAISFFVVGLGEEACKFLAAYLAVFRSREFNEHLDGIIYAIAAGIGFSIVENILYIASFGLAIAPLRATFASLAHIAFSGLAGFYLSKARFSGRRRHYLQGVALAAFLHGLYDFLLVARLASPFFLALLVLLVHSFLLRAINRAQRLVP